MWDVTPDPVRDWDQVVARGVADGTWDFGLVPGRAWDQLGVTSLRPLNTPFLITSTAALEAVLDSDLRTDLLAGLPEAGVVGLDVFPDSLRHPFGFTDPLLGVEDYAGHTIRTPSSDTVDRLFTTYGAKTTDARPDGATQRGTESDFTFSDAPVATGNVTFFPKTEVLAAAPTVLDRLRPDQRAVLTDAASATRAWAFAEQPSDAERGADFCAQGGSIVGASTDQLGALEDAAAPVTGWLRQDAGTARLIDAIRDAVQDVPAEPTLVTCPTAGLNEVDPELASLNGIYAARVTTRELQGSGVGADLIRENSGHYTWVLDDGTWSYDQRARHFIHHDHASGRYTYRDGVLTYFFGDGESMTSRLEIDDRGSIVFRDVLSSERASQPLIEASYRRWTRIGSLPD